MIYVAMHGKYGDDESFIDDVYYTTRKKIEAHIRSMGYKWSKYEIAFMNEVIKKWVRIESLKEAK